jgi:hypothetical protein
MDFKNLKKTSSNQKSRDICQIFVISKKKIQSSLWTFILCDFQHTHFHLWWLLLGSPSLLLHLMYPDSLCQRNFKTILFDILWRAHLNSLCSHFTKYEPIFFKNLEMHWTLELICTVGEMVMCALAVFPHDANLFNIFFLLLWDSVWF